ncbi:hypothetical protein PFISCL1PPCAC_5056, partial [Pristionchus fissidentatus]
LQMLLLISVFLLVAGAGAADMSKIMDACKEVDIACNQTAMELIFTEEATKIGRTVDEHTEKCMKKEESMEWTPMQKFKMSREFARVERLDRDEYRFKNTSEVYPFIKKHLPYSWAAIEKKWAPIKAEQEKMSAETRAFPQGIEQLFLESVVRLSQLDDDDKIAFMKAAIQEGTAIVKKAIVMYKELPEANKLELERYSCVRTLSRVFVEMGLYDQYQALLDGIVNAK